MSLVHFLRLPATTGTGVPIPAAVVVVVVLRDMYLRIRYLRQQAEHVLAQLAFCYRPTDRAVLQQRGEQLDHASALARLPLFRRLMNGTHRRICPRLDLSTFAFLGMRPIGQRGLAASRPGWAQGLTGTAGQ